MTEEWSLSTPDGAFSFQAKYTVGGQETEQEVMGRMAKTSAKWEDDVLVIEFKAEDRPFKRKINLSGNGKIMTAVVTHSEGGGALVEDTLVFEKQ